MFGFLDNPVLELLAFAFVAAIAWFLLYLEMPPSVIQKTGKRVPLSQRLSRLGRTGWWALIVAPLTTIAAVFGIIDLVI